MLEIVGHECSEQAAVFGRDVVEAAVDGAPELGEVGSVTTIQNVAFDEASTGVQLASALPQVHEMSHRDGGPERHDGGLDGF